MIDASTLRDLFAAHRPFHSAHQIDHYIIAKSGGTPYGMFKQAVRELKSRWSGLCSQYIEREELRRNGAPCQCCEPDAEHGCLKLARYRIQIDGLEGQIRDTEREFRRFYAHATKLKAHLGELTEERIEALEAEHWMHKLKQQAALDLLTAGRVQRDTLELLMALDPATRSPIMDLLSSPGGHAELTTWLRAYTPEVDIDRGGALPAIPEGGLRDALLALGSG